MKSSLLPMLLLAGCAATPAPEPAPTRSALYDGFVGQRFAWDHVSGVSGETIHYADGTMVYDSDGRERTAAWTLSVDDRYCMNAGDYDQVCFTLIPAPAGYASEDGTFRYARLPDAPRGPFIGTAPYDASIYDAPVYGAPTARLDATPPTPGPGGVPVYGAPLHDDAMGYDASIFTDATGLGAASELPLVGGPAD